MPIYEYNCDSCGLRQSRLVYSWSAADALACRQCGGNGLTRLVSGFSFHRSWGESLNWVPDNAIADLDNNQAVSIDSHLGRMDEAMGGRVTPDFHEHRREITNPDD